MEGWGCWGGQGPVRWGQSRVSGRRQAASGRDAWSGDRDADEKGLPRSPSVSSCFAATGQTRAAAAACVMLRVLSRLHTSQTCQYIHGRPWVMRDPVPPPPAPWGQSPGKKADTSQSRISPDVRYPGRLLPPV